ncbi:MAG: hypothetical protein B5M56_08905 [Desulfococcus sp. 4484_241]|nr:MAG: hypothetical protein B5M56_08905 [Desulfococcus sp. 4484_241]
MGNSRGHIRLHCDGPQNLVRDFVESKQDSPSAPVFQDMAVQPSLEEPVPVLSRCKAGVPDKKACKRGRYLLLPAGFPGRLAGSSKEPVGLICPQVPRRICCFPQQWQHLPEFSPCVTI